MCRGTASVKQTSRRQHKHPRAYRQQTRTAVVRLAQGKDQLSRHWRAAVAPAGNNDRPRLIQQVQATVGQQLNATHGAHWTLIDCSNAVFIPGEFELRPGQAEYLYGDAKLESAEAVVGQNRDRSRVGVHLAENSR